LIGKNPEKRNEVDMKKVNSTTLRISNTGKYNAQLSFSLMSSIVDNNPEYKKGVFWIEPETMEIPKNDVPKELRVWAIPDAA
jgi:hydrocephalus-inducing protein